MQDTVELMAGRKNGLGRGLDAFFPDRTSVVKEPARKTTTKTVKTEKKSDVAEKQTNPTVAEKQTADKVRCFTQEAEVTVYVDQSY